MQIITYNLYRYFRMKNERIIDCVSTGPVPIGTLTFWVRIGLMFPRDCLEWFHLELLVRSKWICFRIRSQLLPFLWNGSNYARIGSERSSKKSDWCAPSALLLFFAHLLSRFLLHSFRESVPNGTDPVETQSLSVPNCCSSKWNGPAETPP